MATVWRALYVDDDPEYLNQVQEEFNKKPVTGPDQVLNVDTMASFDSALDALAAQRYDLVIVDVRLGDIDEKKAGEAEEEGIRVLDAIKARRFLPVIFYTALPANVCHLGSQLVKIVRKADGLDRLRECIVEVFRNRLPVINRAIIGHFEEVQRQYMWEFVADHWDEFGESGDNAELGILLARRLAVSLSRDKVGRLIAAIDKTAGYETQSGKAHAVEYYVMPPVADDFLTGDIFMDTGDGQNTYYVLLNPCCDFTHAHVDLALFAKCAPLENEKEYVELHSDPADGDKRGALKALLKDSRRESQSERFSFLPKAFSIPDLVVDFQTLVTLALPTLKEYCDSERYKRVASLDSPFAEALSNKFSRYYGRIGKPDLRVDVVLDRIWGSFEAAKDGQ